MDFSHEQLHAMHKVQEWISNGCPDQVFRMFGYAGSGKTTLAKHLVADVSGLVYFACFTGKAASVLRSKGCSGATTIHSLVYVPREKSSVALKKAEDELQRYLNQCAILRQVPDQKEVANQQRKIDALKRNLKQPAFQKNPDSVLGDPETRLLVVDEVSMVSKDIGQDVLSYGCPVLVLGDPGQLPPIKGSGFFTQQKPDVMLTEVHRQAEGSSVIKLATMARKGQILPYGTVEGVDGNSLVCRKGELSISQLCEHDQILVGTNAKRKGLNLKIRKHLGLDKAGPFPVAGDKLICLKNNHDNGLLNGSQWTVKDCWKIPKDEQVVLTLVGEDGHQLETSAHSQYFTGQEDQIGQWDFKKADSFDYGYAITVHKSQGSGWSRVCVVDESSMFKDCRRNHLYTAITRASERVTVIK